MNVPIFCLFLHDRYCFLRFENFDLAWILAHGWPKLIRLRMSDLCSQSLPVQTLILRFLSHHARGAVKEKNQNTCTSDLLVLRSLHVISLEKQRYYIGDSGRSIRWGLDPSSMFNRQSRSLV